MSNLGTTWPEDCGNLTCMLTLNAISSTCSKNSLVLNLTCTHMPENPLVTLLDCGSSDCFIESQVVQKYYLPTVSVPQILLKQTVTFYVTCWTAAAPWYLATTGSPTTIQRLTGYWAVLPSRLQNQPPCQPLQLLQLVPPRFIATPRQTLRS